MTEDKEVVVTFEQIPATVTIHHYIEGTTDKALREYFRIQGNNLIFESGIIPERPITITVTPVVETYWGTIKVAPISFQLSVN